MICDHVGTLIAERIFGQQPWPAKRCASNHGPAETIAQHMPKRRQASGAPGIEPGTSAFSLPKVVTQLGIEPMTTRCLVVVLTTKLLGLCKLVYGRGGLFWAEG